MANEAAVTQTINIVPVQGIFQPEPTFALVTLIGPAGTPFYANINPNQSGLHITDSTIDSSPIGSITPSTGVFTNVDLTTGTITSAPSGPTSIVNQAYVDAVAQGLSFKQPANYVTTGNITLSGLAVQAGGDWPATLIAGDRILVKDQSTAANNGIYVAAAGAWSRASDANTYDEYLGAYLFILSGTLYAGSAWVCTNQPGGTLGVTAITFTQFSNNALYTAGTGLTLTGYQFSITNVGTAGTYGSASQVPVFVTNAQGQVTSVTNTAIAIANTQVSGLGTMSTQNANAVAITGGVIDGTAIGGTTAAAVTGTIVTASTYFTGPGTGLTGTASGLSIGGNAATATSATSATTATNLAGGAAGSVPYQTAFGTTGFLSAGANGQVLTLAAGVPSWATPTTGTVTSVSGTGTVSGLTLTGTVTTSGSLTLGGALDLSSPPAIGGTTANTITGTTITATTKFVGPYFDAATSAGGALRNASGAAQLQWGAGGGNNLSLDVSTNMNGANAQIDISPTGTGHVHIKPAGSGSIEIAPTALGTINNMSIGATTAASGKFTTIDFSSTLAVSGSTGSAGQVLQSNGASAPTWVTPAAYATVTDDTTTNATRYPLFANQTAGNLTTEYVSSTKLQFNPSTGVFTSTSFSGAGTGLTGTASGLSIGGNAATATSATSATTATNLAGGANGSLPYQTGSGATTFLAASTNGYILTLAGGVPTWAAAPLTGITISDDTTTNATRYLTFTSATTGNITSENVSSTKLQFNPSTGALTPTSITPTNAVGIAYGGTGQTTQTAAFDALAPSTTKGDLIVDNGTNNVRLPVGTNGQVLTADSTQANGVKWASAAGGITWQSVQTSSFTATAASAYPINTTSASITATLPASPSAGDQITFVDYAGTFATNNFIVTTNGNKINSTTTTRAFSSNREAVTFVYIDSTQGWIVASDGYLGTVPFANATISTEYLVIAGGGGGGTLRAGGGGAGGYRTASGFSVSAGTNYTVTVGAGGAAGASGSNSVFSTITSTGGGDGGDYVGAGASGGSGGGGSAAASGGSGTSGQGNSGGAGLTAATVDAGGGGGGASTSGGGAVSNVRGGTGGDGTASSITGTSVTRGGGGGGGATGTSTVASGGSGGGGNGGASGNSPVAGSTNLGGGGGGGAGGAGGAGGSGVVIIKYPSGFTISNPGGGLTYSTATSGGFSVTTFTAGTGNVSWS